MLFLAHGPDHRSRNRWPGASPQSHPACQPRVGRQLWARERFATGQLTTIDAEPVVSGAHAQPGSIAMDRARLRTVIVTLDRADVDLQDGAIR